MGILESKIDVGQEINLGPGKLGKKNEQNVQMLKKKNMKNFRI